MKTLTTILIGILTVAMMPMHTAAQMSKKLYEITPDGKFQFTYWQTTGASNAIVHPITPRTFYLETRRQRLISEDFSFHDFLKLPKDQLKTIMEFSQRDVIAAASNIKTSGEINQITAESIHNGYSGYKESAPQVSAETQPEIEYPWLVTGVSQPAGRHEMTDSYALDELPNSQPGEGTTIEMPWIVRLVLLPETLLSLEKQKESTMHAAAPDKRRGGSARYFVSDPATHLMFQDITRGPALQMQNEPSEDQPDHAEKRDRLFALLNHLITYQDDEARRKYGWVFPAMEGKLYGTSEQELDEILSVLLNMKDHFLTSSKPEVNQIFNELEALASW